MARLSRMASEAGMKLTKSKSNVNKWNEQEYCEECARILADNPNTQAIDVAYDLGEQFASEISSKDKLASLPAIEKSFIKSITESSIDNINSLEEFLNMVYTDYMVDVLFESVPACKINNHI